MGREWGAGGGCQQETCFEILIHGSGRGLEHRNEKKKKEEEAGEPLKRGNVLCIRETGAALDGHVGREQVQRFSLMSGSPRLLCTPYGLSVQGVFRVLPFPSPDTNEMSVVSLLIPSAL